MSALSGYCVDRFAWFPQGHGVPDETLKTGVEAQLPCAAIRPVDPVNNSTQVAFCWMDCQRSSVRSLNSA